MTVSRHILALACAWLCCQPAAQAQEMPTFQVTAKNGRLDPPRLAVPAGRKIKLLLKNEGPGPLEFENLALRVEKVLAPGTSSFVVIHNLKPGSYRFVDEFHPDQSECVLTAQ